jgi:UDP-N-acetylglucosamine--N-acetylmuramyl-(pentapeptide) pyrophosphoryl-undecaprenol N-acetylglucosamine transferase
MKGVPFVLHEANSIPGKVNRLMSPHAIMTGIHFPSTAKLLGGETVEVGMPLREGYKLQYHLREVAKNYFNLKTESSKQTLLAFGGSQGALALNKLLVDTLCQNNAEFKERLQVIHITGNAESTILFAEMYQKAGIEACVKDFEKRMDMAWQASDLVFCRAGAGTIAEEMEFEVPGILIPYPFAADFHQNHNASFMTETVGGAEMYLEKDLTSDTLKAVILSMLEQDSAKLKKMKKSIKRYKEQIRQTDFCTLIINILKSYA